MQATDTGRERVDELRAIMAGLDETSETSEHVDLAQSAYNALEDAIGALATLTLSESDKATRHEYMHVWTDVIILAGDLRRSAGIL